MDENGNESWEYQESNCSEDYAIAPDGTIYLLEDDFQNSGNNVLTALDPTTGQIKFTILLPGFDSSAGGADYTYMPPPGDPNGEEAYCTPGNTIPGSSTSTNAQSFEHGTMSIGADGTVYIPLTGGTTFFDGEPCNSNPDPNNPGYPYPVDPTKASWTVTATLYLMAAKPDGTYTIQTVDTRTTSGTNWFQYAPPQYSVFLQRPVSDGQGGVLLPVEQTLYHTGGSNVSLSFNVIPDDLVVGSDGIAYVTGLDSNSMGYIAAIDTNGGSVKSTVTQSGRPTPSLITASDSLVFKYWSNNTPSQQYAAVADSAGNITPLFASPANGSDVGPVIPISFGPHLPSYWGNDVWVAYESDLSIAGIIGQDIGPALVAYTQSGGDKQSRHTTSGFDLELDWCSNGSCSSFKDPDMRAENAPDKDVMFSIRANDLPHGIINLTSAQVQSVKLKAANAYKQAFAAYNVNVGSGRQGTNTVYLVGQSNGDSCGGTNPYVTNASVVYYPNVMSGAQYAINQTSGQPTQALLQAIGEGIGTVAAHETGHQFVNGFKQPYPIVNGMDMEDKSPDTYNGGGCTGSKGTWYYTGVGTDGKTPIYWESDADQSLKNLFGPKN